jgi:hypothetical protein
VDGLLRIRVRDGPQPFAHVHFDAQFLLQLALKTSFERFARFAFAAWELPTTPEMVAGAALSDEDAAIPENDSRGDFNRISRLDGRGWRFAPFARGRVCHTSLSLHRPTLL